MEIQHPILDQKRITIFDEPGFALIHRPKIVTNKTFLAQSVD